MHDSSVEVLYPHLKYSLLTGCGQRHDPEDYLLDFHVRIFAHWEAPDGGERGILLGTLDATLIRLSQALNEGFSRVHLFDHSQEFHDLGCALFDPNYVAFAKPIQEAFSCAFPHDDILYIRQLAVEPFARGQRLGITALHRFISDWDSGCALVVIEPPEPSANLENHFRGVGFRRVGSLPCMLLCPGLRQAPLDELALVDSITVSRQVLEKVSQKGC